MKTTITMPDRVKASPFKWIWIATAVLYLLMLVVTPNAATGRSLVNMMPFVGMLAVATLGQALVMMQRGFDFSLAGIIGMSSIVVADLSHDGVNPYSAVLVTLIVAVACGLLNGVLVTWLALTPVVATLASNSLFLGLGYLVSGGSPILIRSELTDFATGTFLGLANSFWVALATVAGLLVLVRLTAFGRRFLAVGSNPEAARAAGLPVTRALISAYALAGLCFGMTGILISGFVGQGSLGASGTYLMSAIAALMVAGGAVAATRLSLVAAVVGALFISLLDQFILALGVADSTQSLIHGLVLVTAVAVPTVRLPRPRRRAVA